MLTTTHAHDYVDTRAQHALGAGSNRALGAGKLAQPLTLTIPAFRRVCLTLVGCGGTGSHIASGLAALALALREQSVACELTFIDPDTVEPKNVGRQLFGLADIGQPKATVLARRLNATLGLNIGAVKRAIDESDNFIEAVPQADTLYLVVGAVDNPAARAAIAQAVKRAQGKLWWLDCGNERVSGQVALGNCADKKQFMGVAALGLIDRLPAPDVQYPDLVQAPKVKKQKARSCAELTADGEQGLMVNRMAAAWALALLDDFLNRRAVHWFGAAFGLEWGGVTVYTLDAPTLADVVGLTARELTCVAKAASEKRGQTQPVRAGAG
jgi:PRTRC genetic system ThiF family protein